MYKRYEKQEHQENRVIVLLFYRTIFVCFLFLFFVSLFLFFLALRDTGGKKRSPTKKLFKTKRRNIRTVAYNRKWQEIHEIGLGRKKKKRKRRRTAALERERKARY